MVMELAEEYLLLLADLSYNTQLIKSVDCNAICSQLKVQLYVNLLHVPLVTYSDARSKFMSHNYILFCSDIQLT